MENKNHPKVVFKWSRGGVVLLPRGITGSVKNYTFDTAKIQSFFETSK